MRDALVIADDLTGACDTGAAFAAKGFPTRVLFDPTTPDDADGILVVDTDSRYRPADVAAAAVTSTIEAHDAQIIYKKVDSTLRGNVCSEVVATLTTPETLAVVAPAAPTLGRTTACGYHLVDGELVTRTDIGEGDVEHAHIPSMFASCDVAVDHLSIGTIAKGADAIARSFSELPDGPSVVVCDATHETHLQSIATAAESVERPIVYVGSAGLASHVLSPRENRADATAPTRSTDASGGVLAVLGSPADETRRGLECLPEHALVSIDPVDAVVRPDETAAKGASAAAGCIRTAGYAVVTTAANSRDVEDALRAGDNRGYSTRQTGERITRMLTALVAATVETVSLRGMFLTGGATARGVLGELGVHALELTGDLIEPGIPVSLARGGRGDGMVLITKAGGFGDHETLINSLDRLGAT